MLTFAACLQAGCDASLAQKKQVRQLAEANKAHVVADAAALTMLALTQPPLFGQVRLLQTS